MVTQTLDQRIYSSKNLSILTYLPDQTVVALKIQAFLWRSMLPDECRKVTVKLLWSRDPNFQNERFQRPPVSLRQRQQHFAML